MLFGAAFLDFTKFNWMIQKIEVLIDDDILF